MAGLPNTAAGAALAEQASAAADPLIAVVGAGAMGAGIAQVAAAAGYRVLIYDLDPQAADRALTRVAAGLAAMLEKRLIHADGAAAAGERISAAATLADLNGATLVIEAIVEELAAKRALFAALESVVADSCILATNTSSFSISAIAARLRVPGRLVGMHFFNPAPRMTLVEVVSGLATDAAVAARVSALAQAWGKTTVQVRCCPGFIVNRVARPYYAEGLRLLGEQAADPVTLDAVMREAGGFRMGPFELMDLIGHDINLAVTRSVYEASFHDPRFAPSVIQQELVDGGFFGRKAGRGFYHYGPGAPQLLAQSEPPRARPHALVYRAPPDSGAGPRGAAALVAQLARRLAGIPAGPHLHHAVPEPGGADRTVAGLHCDGAALYLTDGRSATQRARDDQHADTVLFDLAFDYAGMARIAVACADQCSPAAFHGVVGLLQAAGLIVTRLDDVPGLAVMRTVAMLANEAAEAVGQGICSVQAADMAMEKGVNYPRGPLAWADSLGIDHVVRVLDHLAGHYGEPRYRVAPLLRRKLAGGASFYIAEGHPALEGS